MRKKKNKKIVGGGGGVKQGNKNENTKILKRKGERKYAQKRRKME